MRPEAINLFKDALKAGLRQKVEALRIDAQPLAAQLDLPLALFAGNVEDFAISFRELVCDLREQRGLANARIAANQYERAGDYPSAEHAVKFFDARRLSRIVLTFDLVISERRHFAHA